MKEFERSSGMIEQVTLALVRASLSFDFSPPEENRTAVWGLQFEDEIKEFLWISDNRPDLILSIEVAPTLVPDSDFYVPVSPIACLQRFTCGVVGFTSYLPLTELASLGDAVYDLKEELDTFLNKP